jgi:hypothetical protein
MIICVLNFSSSRVVKKTKNFRTVSNVGNNYYNNANYREAGTGGGGRRGSCPSCLLLGGARGAEVPLDL